MPGEIPIRQCLVIPYFEQDVGHRPIDKQAHPSYIDYECPYITLNGAAYMGQKLRHGETVDLTVQVKNTGNQTARNVSVSLYWSHPTIKFARPLMRVAMHQVKRIDPGGSPVLGLQYSWVIPDEMPEHFCLLAEVSNSSDPSPVAINVGDRHFAQLNLNLVRLEDGGTIFKFRRVRDEQSEGSIRVRSVEGTMLETVARRLGLSPSGASIHTDLEEVGTIREVRNGDRVFVESEWQAKLEPSTEMRADQFSAVELVADDDETGDDGILVVLTPADH